MKKNIIINAALNEIRIAITESGELAELFIEYPEKERSIGSVYLGRVNKVVQGINAAFVDIGAGHDAFLHFSDIDESLENFITEEDDEDEPAPKIKGAFDDADKLDAKAAADHSAVALRKIKPEETNDKNKATFSTKKLGRIQINLKPKQLVIVQITREAYADKGVKVTTKIAIPGRYVVLLPFENIVGVSKKLSTFQERKRLRRLARKHLPEGFGCIIRTAAAGKSETELRKDWESLLETWFEIEAKVRKTNKPTLLYQDLHLAKSVARDLLTTEVDKLYVDSRKLAGELISYLKWSSPAMANKVEHYKGKKPIFEEFGIERALESTYKRKVPLPSGGSLVFDQTEAMNVVDVNSGRSFSDQKQGKNALLTNLEAAKEIARQIRLRDLAGIIIIDFIDMGIDNYNRKLFSEMKKELSKDRAKTVSYPLTQLTLMQITRQRINQNIQEKTSETCPTCGGSGRIPSKSAIINSVERWLKNFRAHSKEYRLRLVLHPRIAEFFTDGAISRLTKLMLKYFVKIKLVQDENVRIDEFKFFSEKREKEITNDYFKFDG